MGYRGYNQPIGGGENRENYTGNFYKESTGNGRSAGREPSKTKRSVSYGGQTPTCTNNQFIRTPLPVS